MQPTVYWKAEMQQGRFNLRRAVNPRFAYRGTTIAATSIAPITAIQFSVNGACMSALSDFQPVTASMLSSMMAGVVSAAVQSPCQLVDPPPRHRYARVGRHVAWLVHDHGS